jgi:hypothetical protein
VEVFLRFFRAQFQSSRRLIRVHHFDGGLLIVNLPNASADQGQPGDIRLLEVEKKGELLSRAVFAPLRICRAGMSGRVNGVLAKKE